MTPKAGCPKIPFPSRRLRGSQRGLRTSVTTQSGLRGFWPELQMLKNATKIKDFERFWPPEAKNATKTMLSAIRPSFAQAKITI